MFNINKQINPLYSIESLQDLSNESAATIQGGAGPFTLEPNQEKGGIPTNLLGETQITINSKVNGFIELQAGVSTAERNSVRPGRNIFSRGFSASLLRIRNLTNQPITLTTR